MTEEERYAKVEADKQNAINQSNQMYNDLLNSNSQLAQQQKDYINKWETTQNEIADKNAAYQTELQNQNKQKAEKEFQNEELIELKTPYNLPKLELNLVYIEDYLTNLARYFIKNHIKK